MQAIAYRSDITPLFEQWLYDPLLRLIRGLARQVRKLQAGSLHLYLAYIAVVLMVCLLYTSDAADERSSVDPGGRRIIKKNNNINNASTTGTHAGAPKTRV